ncbi:SRPBCC family protein [Streptomyces sp. NRRL F-5123]|uniref:SRPBCC family protein n=1 Tax=Streptomyces sp. NRRL F-5123 TaxID=1463856 RepID=UPI0004E25C55|nr:SRPBCC family protein [Streptomyces sp. NRRL F-5123]
MNSPSHESRHVAVRIARPAAEVYAYAADPAHLPAWAHGLSGAIRHEGGVWVADSPMGRVTVAFAPPNPFGVLDHDVTLPSGETVHNPVRVLPDGDSASEVVFTLRRLPGVTRADFEHDAAIVTADLERLRGVLEAN